MQAFHVDPENETPVDDAVMDGTGAGGGKQKPPTKAEEAAE